MIDLMVCKTKKNRKKITLALIWLCTPLAMFCFLFCPGNEGRRGNTREADADDVVCCSSSGAVRSTSRVVHEARPSAERGERPQGGVGRRSPPGAQHIQRGRSCIATGSAGEEEDIERSGGEKVESGTSQKGYSCLVLLLWLLSANSCCFFPLNVVETFNQTFKKTLALRSKTDQLQCEIS